MPVMTDRRSVAANTTVENILSGKVHEFLPENSVIRVFMAAAAAGINASFLVGSESLVQDQEVSDANRFPQDPEDFLSESGGLEGDRVLLALRNTTGAAIVVITRVSIEPVG